MRTQKEQERHGTASPKPALFDPPMHASTAEADDANIIEKMEGAASSSSSSWQNQPLLPTPEGHTSQFTGKGPRMRLRLKFHQGEEPTLPSQQLAREVDQFNIGAEDEPQPWDDIEA